MKQIHLRPLTKRWQTLKRVYLTRQNTKNRIDQNCAKVDKIGGLGSSAELRGPIVKSESNKKIPYLIYISQGPS